MPTLVQQRNTTDAGACEGNVMSGVSYRIWILMTFEKNERETNSTAWGATRAECLGSSEACPRRTQQGSPILNRKRQR